MAHCWKGDAVQIQNGDDYFKDKQGRRLIPRGVSLSSENKIPKYRNDGAALYDEKHDFYSHTMDVSFVDRPFPLEDADEHFSSLREWGLTFVRLVVTWEALEHKGPGLFDEDYIDYLRKIVNLMPKYGIICCIDMHQDCFSRFSGGSGAPAWTFDLVGFDIEAFHDTGAAYIECEALRKGEQPQDQIWPTNYSKFASRTMFTLFWAGDELAPKLRVDMDGHAFVDVESSMQGFGLSTYLQKCYMDTCCHLAERLQDCQAVIAYDLMNEPHPGYLEVSDFYKFDELTELHFGAMPTIAQSFALGSGVPQSVNIYKRSFPGPTSKAGQRPLNQGGRSVWRTSRECPWRMHGVWDMRDSGNLQQAHPIILKQNYFRIHPAGPLKGRSINFWKDYYLVFMRTLCSRLVAIKPELHLWIESIPNEYSPSPADIFPGNVVCSPHWYDLHSLFSKQFGPVTLDIQNLSRTLNILSSAYFGRKGSARNYARQIRNIVRKGKGDDRHRPCCVGECGVPMDMNSKAAFQTGDYAWQIRALDALCTGLEQQFVSFNLWNYSSLNNHVDGDLWYRENFSIYSRSHGVALDSQKPAREARPRHKALSDGISYENKESSYFHGRCLEAVIRPYPAKIAGLPQCMFYDRKSLKIEVTIDLPSCAESEGEMTTELFLPRYQYQKLAPWLLIEVNCGRCAIDWPSQTLYWQYHGAQVPNEARLVITVIDPISGEIFQPASALQDLLEFIADVAAYWRLVDTVQMMSWVCIPLLILLKAYTTICTTFIP